MADSRRVERVAALIRREMSELLINGIRDERVQMGMISITAVNVAGDLQHCRIFVSVLGSPEEKKQALEGLRSASSYVKGELSRRLKLRRTPEVVFQLDKGLEQGTAVLGVLQRLENERQSRQQAEVDDNDAIAIEATSNETAPAEALDNVTADNGTPNTQSGLTAASVTADPWPAAAAAPDAVTADPSDAAAGNATALNQADPAAEGSRVDRASPRDPGSQPPERQGSHAPETDVP
jgi:ribosome-binding factor A